MQYSKLREQNRLSLKDVSPIPGPLAVYLETTNICNFKCHYCPESFSDFKERSGGLHKMDLDAFRKIALDLKSFNSLKVLNFYMMGEPFVNNSLSDFVKIASETNVAPRLCITTNGSLLTESNIKKILHSGLNYLRVSIYGATEEKHAARTQSAVKLSQIKNNLRALKNRRDELGVKDFQIYIKMIDTRDAVENQIFKDEFSPLGDEVIIEPVMNWNEAEDKNLAGIKIEDLLSTPNFQFKKNVCPFPFYTLVIHSDLRVSVCCVDWAKEAVVGDLKTATIQEIWNSQAMHDFRLMHLEGRRHENSACKNCTFLYTAPDSLDELTAEAYRARINP